MFERLGEIVETNERYGHHEDVDEPAIFTWFPRKSDYEYIPPALRDESVEHKVDRVSKLAKSARSEMVQLTGGDLELEARINNYFELRENLDEYAVIMRECEAQAAGAGDDVQEKVAKGRCVLQEVRDTFGKVKMEETAGQIQVENEFKVGLESNLVPWIDRLELESFRTLDKPDNFAHAQEIEKEAVTFAKEVRKANKLLTALTGLLDKLPSKKMFCSGQLEDQKTRFKKIATVAATRVETTRDLLVNWNFYMETKGEAERLSETVRAMFSLAPLPDQFVLDENDFVHGLPKVCLGWLHLAEQVVAAPPRPTDLLNCGELAKQGNQFCAVAELASKLLERVEECTEKTPAHQEVWDQRARMKAVQAKAKKLSGRQETLVFLWQALDVSESKDNLDFQPLVTFLHFYSECYA